MYINDKVYDVVLYFKIEKLNVNSKLDFLNASPRIRLIPAAPLIAETEKHARYEIDAYAKRRSLHMPSRD